MPQFNMKPSAISSCVLEEPVGLRPEGNVIFSSSTHPEPRYAGENTTDAFGFALDWPACQVVCDTRSEVSWEEDALPSALPAIRSSNTINRDIKESALVFHTLARGERAHPVREVNALGRVYPRKEIAIEVFTNHPYANRLQPTGIIADIYSDSISDSAHDNALQRLRGSKRGFISADSANDERRKRQRPTYLPPEIMEMVISHVTAAEPRCALSLVVPDWGICPTENSEPQVSSRIVQFVTYARGMGVRVGTLSYNYEHGGNGHVLTPARDFDPNVVALNVTFCSEYTRNYYRNHTHVFTLGTTDLRGGTVGGVLGNDWRDVQPLRSLKLKNILPFDDEPIELVKRRASLTPNPIYQLLRHIAVHSPLELMQVNADSLQMEGDAGGRVDSETLNNALDLDRAAHLWLSWSHMPQLESVFLDLRIYSHDLNTRQRCLSKFQVMERAKEMGRHLQLKILVLAGLQSYSFHVVYEGVTARDIEQWEEIDGEPNWIRIFRPAIRGGGKIMLVDKLFDNVYQVGPVS